MKAIQTAAALYLLVFLIFGGIVVSLDLAGIQPVAFLHRHAPFWTVASAGVIMSIFLFGMIEIARIGTRHV